MKYAQRLQSHMKYGILTISIAFILVGIIRKEHLEVMKKAAKRGDDKTDNTNGGNCSKKKSKRDY